jgi:hypothetical protein
MIRKLVASDEAVKTLFDHFRNIGIAGAVLAAGAWTLTHQATGLLSYMSLASGMSLCVLGVFLLIVAERHGHKKLRDADLPMYWDLIVRLVYGLALFSLFAVAAQRIELH